MLHHGANEAYAVAATGAQPGIPGNKGPAATAAPQQLSSIDPAVFEAAETGVQGSNWAAPALATQAHAELPLEDKADVPGTSKAQAAAVAEWSDSIRLAISTRCLLAALSTAQRGICYTQVPPRSSLSISPSVVLQHTPSRAVHKF